MLAEGVNLQQAGQMINYDLPWNPMRIVQRHGRVDRIGSKHDYVYLGLFFFPAERLDALLELEARLESKLALADAAVGAGEVLPGRGPGHEVNLADDRVIDEFEKLLDAGGSSASLSGEEYRRRLFGAFNMEPVLKSDVLSLPHGSGSGFVNPVVRGNGYVFCVKIGKSAKPGSVTSLPTTIGRFASRTTAIRSFRPTLSSHCAYLTRRTPTPSDGSRKTSTTMPSMHGK